MVLRDFNNIVKHVNLTEQTGTQRQSKPKYSGHHIEQLNNTFFPEN